MTHGLLTSTYLACLKCATSPIFECLKPFEDEGWEMSDEGNIEVLWSKGPVLMASFIDILNCCDIDAEIEDIEEMMSVGMVPQMMNMMDMNRHKNSNQVLLPDIFCVNRYCAIDIFVVMFIWYLDFETDIIWWIQFYLWVSPLLLKFEFNFF